MSVDNMLHKFIDALYIKHGKNLPNQQIIDKFIDIFISELDIKNRFRPSVTINNKISEKSYKQDKFESIEFFELGPSHKTKFAQIHIAHIHKS